MAVEVVRLPFVLLRSVEMGELIEAQRTANPLQKTRFSGVKKGVRRGAVDAEFPLQ